MATPFRIGVMQLTMEPLDEMLESARVMDRVGLDTIWLAEAYPWRRKHGMEARSSTVTSALIARETERLLSRADEVVLLADSRKFSIRTRYSVLALSRISTLITDDGLTQEHARMLEDAGIRTIIARIGRDMPD